MGVAVPATLFFLLQMQRPSQFFTLAATSFLAWGVADLLATILEKPRLRDRSARQAIEEEWERRAKD
jgi:hypothetical protein